MGSSQEPLANKSDQDGHATPLILIVDDEAPIAQALSLIVEDAGYTAITAYRGVDGLDFARAYHPALILTDIMMPQMDGVALIAAVRADAAAAHRQAPYIIAMTAGALRFAQLAEADAVLQKPFSIEEVESLLERFLAKVSQDSEGAS